MRRSEERQMGSQPWALGHVRSSLTTPPSAALHIGSKAWSCCETWSLHEAWQLGSSADTKCSLRITSSACSLAGCQHPCKASVPEDTSSYGLLVDLCIRGGQEAALRLLHALSSNCVNLLKRQVA